MFNLDELNEDQLKTQLRAVTEALLILSTCDLSGYNERSAKLLKMHKLYKSEGRDGFIKTVRAIAQQALCSMDIKISLKGIDGDPVENRSHALVSTLVPDLILALRHENIAHGREIIEQMAAIDFGEACKQLALIQYNRPDLVNLSYWIALSGHELMFETSYLWSVVGTPPYTHAQDFGLNPADIEAYQQHWRDWGIDPTKIETLESWIEELPNLKSGQQPLPAT